MNKNYISIVDYQPREPGQLRIRKNDHIVFMDIDDGWCRGKNLTTGSQGIFPKLYLGTSRSCTSNFTEIVGEIATVCSKVDKLIAGSSYLTSDAGRASLHKRLETLHSIGPFFYLTSGCAGGIWEQCIRNFISAFQEAKVKVHEYFLCVDALKRHAANLDKWIPRLISEILKYPRVLPSALRHAECMQATLKSLIDTADKSFEWYKPKDQTTDICPFRGPSRSFTLSTTGSSATFRLISTHPTADTHIYDPAAPNRSSTRFFLMSYHTLSAITVVTCLVATAFQLLAYTLSSSSPGHIGDSDFYSNLQSALMQSLTTYTGLVPAIRVRELRGFISVLWVSMFLVAGLVLNFAAMGIYFHNAGMTPLLSFFGNVTQAITVLHLAFRIERCSGLDASVGIVS